MLSILAMYVGIGALFAVLGVPLALGRVPPNGWYGLRVSKTMKPGNEHIWYAANAYSGRLMIWSGAITSLGAAVLWFVKGFTIDTYSLACMAVMLLSVLVMIVLSLKYVATLK